jgi:hypothetical protein
MKYHRRQVPRIRLNMNIERRKVGEATIQDYAYVVGVNMIFCAIAAGAMAGFMYLLVQ